MAEELIRAVNESDGNSSTTISLLSKRKIILIGYPGPMFTTIHISALCSITTSVLISAILIIYLCGCTCRRKPSKAKIKRQSRIGKKTRDRTSGDSDNHTKGSSSVSASGAMMQKGKQAAINTQHIRYFWKWSVGERFVLYIAVCDIGFGISHSIDHIYVYHVVDYPPDLLCAFFGFVLHQFIIGQWFVITICAISACSLVVFGKKISLGRWDWRLFAVAFVLPLIVGIFGIVYRMFGPTGDWCFMNVGTVPGLRYYMVTTIFQIVLFGVVAVAYAAIWLKIQRTAGLMKDSSTERYQSSARMMLILVAAFIFQWWSLAFFNIWVLIAINPPPAIYVLIVIIDNLGGMYNCFAYTIIRRQLQKQAKNSGANVVVSGNNKPVHDAMDRTSTTASTSVPIEDATTEVAATTSGTADDSEQDQPMRF